MENSIRKNVLYASGLPHNISDMELTEIFGKYGIIISINFPEMSNKYRRSVYLEYLQEENAIAARRDLHGMKMHEQRIFVDYAPSNFQNFLTHTDSNICQNIKDRITKPVESKIQFKYEEDKKIIVEEESTKFQNSKINIAKGPHNSNLFSNFSNNTQSFSINPCNYFNIGCINTLSNEHISSSNHLGQEIDNLDHKYDHEKNQNLGSVKERINKGKNANDFIGNKLTINNGLLAQNFMYSNSNKLIHLNNINDSIGLHQVEKLEKNVISSLNHDPKLAYYDETLRKQPSTTNINWNKLQGQIFSNENNSIVGMNNQIHAKKTNETLPLASVFINKFNDKVDQKIDLNNNCNQICVNNTKNENSHDNINNRNYIDLPNTMDRINNDVNNSSLSNIPKFEQYFNLQNENIDSKNLIVDSSKLYFFQIMYNQFKKEFELLKNSHEINKFNEMLVNQHDISTNELYHDDMNINKQKIWDSSNAFNQIEIKTRNNFQSDLKNDYHHTNDHKLSKQIKNIQNKNNYYQKNQSRSRNNHNLNSISSSKSLHLHENYYELYRKKSKNRSRSHQKGNYTHSVSSHIKSSGKKYYEYYHRSHSRSRSLRSRSRSRSKFNMYYNNSRENAKKFNSYIDSKRRSRTPPSISSSKYDYQIKYLDYKNKIKEIPKSRFRSHNNRDEPHIKSKESISNHTNAHCEAKNKEYEKINNKERKYNSYKYKYKTKSRSKSYSSNKKYRGKNNNRDRYTYNHSNDINDDPNKTHEIQTQINVINKNFSLEGNIHTKNEIYNGRNELLELSNRDIDLNINNRDLNFKIHSEPVTNFFSYTKANIENRNNILESSEIDSKLIHDKMNSYNLDLNIVGSSCMKLGDKQVLDEIKKNTTNIIEEDTKNLYSNKNLKNSMPYVINEDIITKNVLLSNDKLSCKDTSDVVKHLDISQINLQMNPKPEGYILDNIHSPKELPKNQDLLSQNALNELKNDNFQKFILSKVDSNDQYNHIEHQASKNNMQNNKYIINDNLKNPISIIDSGDCILSEYIKNIDENGVSIPPKTNNNPIASVSLASRNNNIFGEKENDDSKKENICNVNINTSNHIKNQTILPDECQAALEVVEDEVYKEKIKVNNIKVDVIKPPELNYQKNEITYKSDNQMENNEQSTNSHLTLNNLIKENQTSSLSKLQISLINTVDPINKPKEKKIDADFIKKNGLENFVKFCLMGGNIKQIKEKIFNVSDQFLD